MKLQEWSGGADGRKEQKTRTIQYPEGDGMMARGKRKKQNKTEEDVDGPASECGGRKISPSSLS